jgi:hypothetical protein
MTSGGIALFVGGVAARPWKITSLRLKPACGAHGAHGFDGSYSEAMRYSSRSSSPFSSRMMNGTRLDR